MSNFEKLLTEIKKDISGKSFEKFCKWFLENDPYWKTQVDKVWLWDDWPERWHIDKGIDLVFKHKNGQNWAVQCKCYSEDYYIKKEDIDSFLSESSRRNIQKRLLIGTTDKIGGNAKETMNGQEKSVRSFLLSELRDSFLQYPSSLKGLNSKAKKKRINKDRPYQQQAITKVLEGFKTHDRGKLIMACGTGKTLVTLWIKEKLKSKTTLVLLPSLNLLSQTLFEWTTHCKDAFEVLCICSDTTVGKQDRAEDMKVNEAHFDVTSDISIISQFLKLDKSKVIFCTYQSSDLVSQAQKKEIIDLVICDEAHRCTGLANSTFTHILDNKKIKARKRLFTTATPRIFPSLVKTVASNKGKEIYGMDDELIYGPDFFEYTFGKAIKDKWLTDYQVVIVGVDEPAVKASIDEREIIALNNNKYDDAESLASKIAVAKAIKDYDINRMISFHNRVKEAKNFSKNFDDILELLNKKDRPKGLIWTDFISGQMSTKDRKIKLHQLKELLSFDRGIISNARCLSEGVDVPTLDGIAFIEPKGSQIDIIQSVGRALRKSQEKTIGTIILPVYLNKDENEIKTIEKSNFKPVWDVLKALRSHDNILANELDGFRQNLAKKGKIKKIKLDKIILDLPKNYNKIFAQNIFTILVEHTTAPWHFWIGLLEEFYKEHNHTIVPQNYIVNGKHKLGSWVSTTRKRKNILTEEKISQLENYKDWVWNYEDYLFEVGFSHLKSFKKKYGHYDVKGRYKTEDGFRLGNWVYHRREDKTLNRLSEERLKRFDNLDGWFWSLRDKLWTDGIKNLKIYEKKFGNVLVPHDYTTNDGFQLGTWVVSRRREKKQNILPDIKIKELIKFKNWSWDALDYRWNLAIRSTKEYIKNKGTISIPYYYKTADGFELGRWVTRRRHEYHNGTLEQSKVKEISLIKGWDWNPIDTSWQNAFEKYKNYVKRNKTTHVKEGTKSDDGFDIYKWVLRQKKHYKNEKLKKNYIHKLNEIEGWTWDTLNHFEISYNRLKKYLSLYHSYPKQKCKRENGSRLHQWIYAQKKKYVENKLSEEEIKKLKKLPNWKWK